MKLDLKHLMANINEEKYFENLKESIGMLNS